MTTLLAEVSWSKKAYSNTKLVKVSAEMGTEVKAVVIRTGCMKDEENVHLLSKQFPALEQAKVFTSLNVGRLRVLETASSISIENDDDGPGQPTPTRALIFGEMTAIDTYQHFVGATRRNATVGTLPPTMDDLERTPSIVKVLASGKNVTVDICTTEAFDKGGGEDPDDWTEAVRILDREALTVEYAKWRYRLTQREQPLYCLNCQRFERNSRNSG